MKKTFQNNCEFYSDDGCSLITESKELKLLQKLTQLISEADDFDSALNIIMETFCQEVGCDYSEAWIPQYNSNTLKCSNIWHSDKIKLNNFTNISKNLSLKKNQGLPGKILESKKPEWITDISENKKHFSEFVAVNETDINTSYGIPIILNQRVQIILIFFLKEHLTENSNLTTLISTVATQLGWVIKHKEFEERFRKSFQYSFDGRAVIDINGKFLEVNNSLCKMLGYSEKQLLSKLIQELLSNDALDQFMINIQKLLTKEITIDNNEVKFYTKTGKVIWVQLEITIVFNTINLPLYFIIQAQDITKHKLEKQENESLSMKLVTAESKINSLNKLLPVCAWCKKIRTENGEWEDLEEYLRHSNIELTHGICNDCAEKIS